MKCSKLLILAVVLFFGMACAQEKPKSLPVKSTEDKNIVFNCVDKEAVFSKGGDNGFRELVAIAIDTDKIDEYEDFPEEEKKEIQKLISENKPTPSVMLSTTLTFIIEPDGTMSNILAEGENQSFNKEMERVVKEDIKDKWYPAEVKGKKVRSYYKMPIRMRIG
jgi:tonB family protein